MWSAHYKRLGSRAVFGLPGNDVLCIQDGGGLRPRAKHAFFHPAMGKQRSLHNKSPDTWSMYLSF